MRSATAAPQRTPAPASAQPAPASAQPPQTPRTSAVTLPLSDLQAGQCALITDVSTSRGTQLARRLADLGLEVGRTIAVERRAPLGDPTVYTVASYHISLRRSEAALITVARSAEAPDELSRA